MAWLLILILILILIINGHLIDFTKKQNTGREERKKELIEKTKVNSWKVWLSFLMSLMVLIGWLFARTVIIQADSDPWKITPEIRGETKGLMIQICPEDWEIIKTNPNYSLQGAQFNIYKDSQGSEFVQTITTDARGIADFYTEEPEIEVDPWTHKNFANKYYYFQMIKAPQGFELESKELFSFLVPCNHIRDVEKNESYGYNEAGELVEYTQIWKYYQYQVADKEAYVYLYPKYLAMIDNEELKSSPLARDDLLLDLNPKAIYTSAFPSLAGISFKLTYSYPVLDQGDILSNPDGSSHLESREWILQSDEKGEVHVRDDYNTQPENPFIHGYRDFEEFEGSDGQDHLISDLSYIVFALGSISIEQIDVPKGYYSEPFQTSYEITPEGLFKPYVHEQRLKEIKLSARQQFNSQSIAISLAPENLIARDPGSYADPNLNHVEASGQDLIVSGLTESHAYYADGLAGYKPCADFTIEPGDENISCKGIDIQVDPAETTHFWLDLVPKNYSLHLTATDEQNQPVKEKVFELFEDPDGNNLVATKSSSQQGMVEFNDLEPGKIYYLKALEDKGDPLALQVQSSPFQDLFTLSLNEQSLDKTQAIASGYFNGDFDNPEISYSYIFISPSEFEAELPETGGIGLFDFLCVPVCALALLLLIRKGRCD